MKKHFRAPLAFICLVWITTHSAPSQAEWTQARGDATRAARVTGLETMDDAQVSWRFFVGGSLAAHNHLLVPSMEDDSAPEIVMVAANRAVRTRIDDVLLWESEGFSITRFVGLFDLDGDETKELVALGRLASGAAAAFVINVQDGSLLWNSEEGDVGQLRDTARVVDMTGDGLPDLYLADAGTNLPGSIAYGVHLYSFEDGAQAGKKVWTMSKSPGRDYFVSLMDAVGDFDGDGSMDVFAQGLKKVYVYSGKDGKLLGSAVSGNTAAGRSEVVLVDLDGDGDHEIVTFAPGGWALSINQVRAAVFDWNSETSEPVMVWERGALDLEKDRISYHSTSVANVDGDPGFEVVVSFFEGDPGQWKTEVLDALTGDVESSIDGKRVDSTLDIDGDGVHELFFHDEGMPLEVAKVVDGVISIYATAPDLRVLKCLHRSQTATQALATVPCAKFNETSGELEVIVGAYDDEKQIKDLRKMVFKDGAAVEKESFIPSPNVRFTAFDALGSLHPKAAWMGVLSSGRLIQFDGQLTPLNYVPDAEQPVLGLKIPSYDPGFGDLARFPIGIDLDEDGAVEIGAVTSDSRAVFADVKAATLAGHTVSVISHNQATAVVAGRSSDGAPRVVVVGSEILTCLDASGDVLWTADAFDPQSQIKRYGDVVTVDLDGDGSTEVVTQTRDSTNGEQSLLAWSIEDGTPRFKSLIDENNSGMRRLAAGRIQGQDSPPKIIGGRPSTLWSFDGDTGQFESLTEMTKLGVHEVVIDVDNDGKDDVLAVNRESLELFDSSGDTVWSNDTALIKPNLGSVSFCDGESFYLSASSRGTSLWRRRLSDGVLVEEVTLAGGLVFGNEEEAEAAGLVPSSLGNTLSFVTDTGQEGVAVGAQDGTLTALNSCDFTLLYSVKVNAPLREVMAVDWDGDGAKELVLSAADGYVYGVDRKEMEAPVEVLDTDPPRGITDEDVDDIETTDTLYATWSPVQGAISYHVGIFTNDGLAVLEDSVDMGPMTEGSFEGLTLQLGQRYIVSVQAKGESGMSASTLSNGVTVVDVSDPTASLSANINQGYVGSDSFVFAYNASDSTAVEHATLRVEALGEEKSELLFDMDGIHQSELEGQVEWSPDVDWPIGATMVRFEVIDGAGHKSTALVELELMMAISPEPDVGDAAEEDLNVDAGTTGDLGSDAGPDAQGTGGSKAQSGCACSAGTSPVDLSGFLVLAIWFMMRRRRHPWENSY